MRICGRRAGGWLSSTVGTGQHRQQRVPPQLPRSLQTLLPGECKAAEPTQALQVCEGSNLGWHRRQLALAQVQPLQLLQ